MQADDYVGTLRKQHYIVFGSNQHSAAKPCTWLKKSLKNEGVCYKQKFYGIDCHRCLQMTPNIYCNQRCIFCWRVYDSHADPMPSVWDEPQEIMQKSFESQVKALNGYGGNAKVDPQKFKEAQKPNQVALSLTGEPTGYPYLDELVNQYNSQNCSTFVVSNGMYPEMIEKVRPTQLYVSLDAPDPVCQKKLNVPFAPNAWETLNSTLDILKDHRSRTALRVTVVKGYNDINPEGYAKLIQKAEPDFLEVKGYMFIGGSRQRLSLDQMPHHEYVKEFAEKINSYLGYEFVGEQPISRVVLYSSGKHPAKIPK